MLFVVHVLVDVLHRLGQRAFGESGRWLGLGVAAHSFEASGLIASFHARQALRPCVFAITFAFLGVVGSVNAESVFPAIFCYHVTVSKKLFAGNVQLDSGIQILMDGIKLSQVVTNDEVVNGSFFTAELRRITCLNGWNDAVVRSDFCIVPGLGFNFWVGPVNQTFQLWHYTFERFQDGRRISKLRLGQIGAISTWVGRELVSFIQRLAGGQNCSGAVAKVFGRQNGNVCKRQ
ncbi:hypothetical protein D3C85_910690 [compost metagenome]